MKSLIEAISSDKEIFSSEQGKEILQRAILKLPEDQQRVLNLYFANQVPIKKISLELCYSITTTYGKLNKALFTLKNELNPAAYESMYKVLYPETGKPSIIR